MKHNIWALALVPGLLALVAGCSGPAEPPAQTVADDEGFALVEMYCASCHAIGRTGESPHQGAPPFRTLHERYDVSLLEEGLVEGLVSGHPDMPEFEFDPPQAGAIVRYLKGLE